jgi:hypothetical protein
LKIGATAARIGAITGKTFAIGVRIVVMHVTSAGREIGSRTVSIAVKTVAITARIAAIGDANDVYVSA